MRRFPDGVEKGGFWEKRCPSHRPEWVKTVKVWSKSNEEEIEFCSAGDRATLVWLANLADIELHVTLAKAAKIEHPTALAFDLDPGEPADVLDCAFVALEIRDLLGELDLDCWAKTSGSKGLQVYVPLSGAATFDVTKPFAKAMARTFEDRYPERVVSRMRKYLRRGRVLVDWSQNDEHKTTVCAYSVRATSHPRVSTPVAWEEVEEACGASNPALLDFSPSEVLARLEQHGDLFAGALAMDQDLPDTESLPG